MDKYDIMEEEYNDEFFEIDNIAGPGNYIKYQDDKIKLKDIKLNKREKGLMLAFTTVKSLLPATIFTEMFTGFIPNGVTKESNILFALITLTSFPIILPISNWAFKSDKRKRYLDAETIDYEKEDINNKSLTKKNNK